MYRRSASLKKAGVRPRRFFTGAAAGRDGLRRPAGAPRQGVCSMNSAATGRRARLFVLPRRRLPGYSYPMIRTVKSDRNVKIRVCADPAREVRASNARVSPAARVRKRSRRAQP